MRIKLPQNRYQPQPPIEVNKKQSNTNVQHQPTEQAQKSLEVIPKLRSKPSQIVVGDGQKQKAMKYREKQLSQDVASRREKMRENGEPIMDGFEDVENTGNFNDIMNKISMMDLPRQYKMNPEEIVRNLSTAGSVTKIQTFQMDPNANIRVNEAPEKPADYDYYDAQPGQRYMQSMRRNWNANNNNRGIRSENNYGSKRWN